MEFSGVHITEIILLVVIIVVYLRVFKAMNSKVNRDSRAARFRVGGRKFGDLVEKEESKEEHLKKRKVSLRQGSMFHRRYR